MQKSVQHFHLHPLFLHLDFPLYIFLAGSTGSCSFFAAGDATPTGFTIPTLQASSTFTNDSTWEIISYFETNSEASVGKNLSRADSVEAFIGEIK